MLIHLVFFGSIPEIVTDLCKMYLGFLGLRYIQRRKKKMINREGKGKGKRLSKSAGRKTEYMYSLDSKYLQVNILKSNI